MQVVDIVVDVWHWWFSHSVMVISVVDVQVVVEVSQLVVSYVEIEVDETGMYSELLELGADEDGLKSDKVSEVLMDLVHGVVIVVRHVDSRVVM